MHSKYYFLAKMCIVPFHSFFFMKTIVLYPAYISDTG